MFKKLLLTVATFLLTAGAAFAQTGTLTGSVTDANSDEPLPGVNVFIPDLQRGAATDAEGQFTIEGIEYGTYTVRASFIGYTAFEQEVTIDQETVTLSIELEAGTQQLEDIVVTALGVETEERTLGYSVQNVSGEELSEAKTSNFVNSLKGKVAGANITSSNAMGGSSRIVLRGESSLTGNNQPLFIVDGIPLDNSNFQTNAGQATGGGGYDYGNAISSIDPNNIQSVSVLKGASATALYGSRGANGVVQITTKDGSQSDGLGVTIKSSVKFDQVYGLPDYQNKYGGGTNAPFEMQDGQLFVDYSTDESWGPRLDGRMVRQWYSFDNVNGLKGQETPWVAHPDNVKDFFNTGTTFNNYASISKGGEDYSYNLSFSRADHKDIYPNGKSTQNQVGFNGQAGLTSKLSASVSVNYIYDDFTGRPGTGYSGVNVFQQFNHFGQRQQDLAGYAKDYLRSDGTQRGWNWAGIGGAKSGDLNFMNNPYWVRYKNYESDDKQRVFGKAALTYDINDWLNVKGNVRTDYYTTRRNTRYAVGSQEQSRYTQANREVQETNARATLNFDRRLNESFTLDGLVGGNIRFSNYSRNLGRTAGGLSVPGVYTVENSKARPTIVDYYQKKRVNSLLAKAKVGYNEMLYLELTGRNDWSSTLPSDNNSFFYYGATGTFIFTDLDAFQNTDVLSFGKVFASYSKVGSDTDPYRLRKTFNLTSPFGSKPQVTVPSRLNNAELKPEQSYAWEVGTNLEFLQSRAKLQLTYYNRRTEDQILPIKVSRASGYETQVVNAGQVSNKGLEAELQLTPVQLSNGFRWTVSANWAKNVSSVDELARGVQNYQIDTFPFGASVNAPVGGSYGMIRGTDFKYYKDTDKKVINPDGTFAVDKTQNDLGSFQPDWTGGVSTTFYYKGLSASVAIDGQKGGHIYSITNMFGNYSGILAASARGDVREAGLIAEGVQADGSKNTVRADPEEVFKGLQSNVGANVFDASYIKLRNVRIGYAIPATTFESTFLKGATVSVSGQNLATLFKNAPNFDPETALSATNAQGVEAGQIPPVRSYSFTVQL
ncbi:MAG TPA: SusC/RagA family TonB-linked outer membrane protein, partial [Fodinibius sp.]|nr:SusC/RagA family TonB-linked outer membrane protein [Fodinibius sp.]